MDSTGDTTTATTQNTRSSSTLVTIVYEHRLTKNTLPLFTGTFPRRIASSDITWNIIAHDSNTTTTTATTTTTTTDNEKNKNTTKNNLKHHNNVEYDTDANADANADANTNIHDSWYADDQRGDGHPSTIVVFRLQYPYDLCNTAVDPSVEDAGWHPNSSSSNNTSTILRDINGVLCGFCYQPLLIGVHASSDDDDDDDNDNDDANTHNVIRRVLPLPVGQWDEIADYVLCYEGVSVIKSDDASIPKGKKKKKAVLFFICFILTVILYCVCPL